jgi:hypothetical protein
MCLIFDRFESREAADKFAAAITEKFGRKASVYDNQVESEPIRIFDPNGGLPIIVESCVGDVGEDGKLKDFFPFKLDGPIVLVERNDANTESEITKQVEIESAIEEEVEKYTGEFAGT